MVGRQVSVALLGVVLACTPLTVDDRVPAGGCVRLPPGSSTIYVDARAAAGGTGVAACPLRTLTSALAAASPGATLQVAAGTYDEALGEVFPLVVRGVSIVGDGVATTTIRGRGHCPALNPRGPSFVECAVALVVGHDTIATSVTGIAIASDAGTASGYLGVLCDRGNAPPQRGARAAPNTTFDRTSFGPAFGIGIVATTYVDATPTRSACNLSVTASTFQGGLFGVWAVGDDVDGLRPAVEIGHVGFSRHHNVSKGFEATGVAISDGVGSGRIHDSTFSSSEAGIVIAQHHDYLPSENHFEISNNQFSALSSTGVHLAFATVVDILSGNTFTGITNAGGTATALLLDGAAIAPPTFPAVRRARGNSFVGNDIAIEFRGPATLDTLSPAWNDFGTSTDPGGNVFRCNSGTQGTTGFDLLVGASASGGALTLPFFGNMWDHSPPTGSGTVDGTDVRITAATPPGVDVGGATIATTACPAGRQP